MEAAPPMIPLVLDLEKQAAALVARARADADALRQKAAEQRDADAKAFLAETAAQVARLEDEAKTVRENEVNKLRSVQAADLDAVRGLAASKLAAGADLVLARLRETQA